MYTFASQLLRSSSVLPNCPLSCSLGTLQICAYFSLTADAALKYIHMNNSVYALPFQLQRITGCRAAEVWHPQWWGESSSGLVTLESCKGNAIRIFSEDDSKAIRPLLSTVADVVKIGFTYDNYRRICRAAWREAGVYMCTNKGQHIGSSHLLRHIYIKLLLAAGIDANTVRLYVGERTEKSFNHYVNSRIFTKY